MFQGATEDEIGALLKLGGALWAGRSLAPDVPAPEFDADTIQHFVGMIQLYEGDFEPKRNGHPGGLGRSLDAYLGGKSDKESKRFLSDISGYLVDVARQSSGVESAADLKKAGWPAAMETRGSLPGSCPRKTCRCCPMERPWTSS